MSRTLLLILLWVSPAWAQVAVEVRLDKAEYLAGEPVFVVLDVMNVGTHPVGYERLGPGSPFSKVDLTVVDTERRQTPNLWGCFIGGQAGGVVGGTAHPPLLQPGERTSYELLLRDYDLSPGRYTLRAAGAAPVRWTSPSVSPGPTGPAPPPYPEMTPVPGAVFDRTVALVVRPTSEDDLREAFEPYVTAAVEPPHAGQRRARAAIMEWAPPFLEDLIAELAADPDILGATGALGRLNTPTSRAHLRRLFDESRRLDFRSGVVGALARTGHRDTLEFLASILPGRSTPPDDRMRQTAALGIGLIGGPEAVDVLRRAFPGRSRSVQRAIVIALGHTRSADAVPALIDADADPDIHSEVCSALKTLTHHTWCGGSADVQQRHARWRRWWEARAATAQLYGLDECPGAATPLPLVP